jgi:serine/threonine protein kinase
VILYAILCGYLPFDDDPSNVEGNNINLLYKYILETKLRFPKHVSELATSLVNRILVTDPTLRATMDEIKSHRFEYLM